ncbi:MAG: hypothetical protein ACFFCC_04575 [Promethearchaeota archaeon]
MSEGGLFNFKTSPVLTDFSKACQISGFSRIASVKRVNFCRAGYDCPLMI